MQRKLNLKIIKSKIQHVVFSSFVSLALLFIFSLPAFVQEVLAQNAIDLAITPPILEVMIKPGKEIRQQFSISNGGGDMVLTPKVVAFKPNGNFGNVELTDIQGPDWIKYKSDPINIKNGESVNFYLLISPPEDVPEMDHYLSLVFESTPAVDLLGQNMSFHKAQIGSLLLITATNDGNPKKSAQIVKFSAPKVVDSLLGEINYQVILKNDGNSFWKPVGKITINDSDTLTLAPQNILSGYQRELNCLDGEKIIECSLGKKLLKGKYSAKLEFKLDGTSDPYLAESTTFAFPFILLLPVILLVTMILLTKRSKKIHSKSKRL